MSGHRATVQAGPHARASASAAENEAFYKLNPAMWSGVAHVAKAARAGLAVTEVGSYEAESC